MKNLQLIVFILVSLLIACAGHEESKTSPTPQDKLENSKIHSQLSMAELVQLLSNDKCVRELVMLGKDYWANTMVGGDLAKEYLKAKKLSIEHVNVGIIDVGFQSRIRTYGRLPADYFTDRQFDLIDNVNENNQGIAIHGTIVADLIFDRYFGISNLGNLRELDFIDFWDNHREANVKIINRSGGFLPEDIEPLKQFIENGGIYVQGAGNDYSTVSPHYIDGSEFSPQVNISRIINVGAIDLNGLVSSFSEEFEDVTILAPGTDIYARDYRGAYGHRVSGTSFATPIVTGALVNVLALQPQLNLNQLRQMLKKTGFRSLYHSLVPDGLNGAGVLNAYALVRVAENPGLDQTAEALRLQEKAKSMPRGASCSERVLAFNNLRESFYMDPTQDRASLLAELYFKFGLVKEAVFMGSLELNYDEGFTDLKRRFEHLIGRGVSLGSPLYQQQLSFLRFISRFSEESEIYGYFLERIKELVEMEHDVSPEAVSKLEGRALFLIRDLYLKGNRQTRAQAMFQIGSMINSQEGNLVSSPLYAPKVKNAKVLIKIIRDLIKHPSVESGDRKWLRKWCAHFDKTFKESYLKKTGKCLKH